MKTVEIDIDDEAAETLRNRWELINSSKQKMTELNQIAAREFDRLVAEDSMWAAAMLSLGMIIMLSGKEQLRIKDIV